MKKLLTILFAVALVPASWGQSDCPEPLDSNQDGYIGVEDLMNLLSYFGDSDSDLDGIFDTADACTDVSACNYSANPTDPCEWLDAVGVCAGSCESDFEGDGICDEFFGPCNEGLTINYEGYTYDLVAIGDQCWFAENLRNMHYANGDIIPELSSEWSSTTEGAQAVFNNNVEYLNDWGRLYNWYAVDDVRGLCPSGWHISTDPEFNELTNFLGGSLIAGDAMKSSPGDNPSWDGSNSSGFSGLGGGTRQYNGWYYVGGSIGYFWSSTPSENQVDKAWCRTLHSGSDGLGGYETNLRNGFSVRCLKD